MISIYQTHTMFDVDVLLSFDDIVKSNMYGRWIGFVILLTYAVAKHCSFVTVCRSVFADRMYRVDRQETAVLEATCMKVCHCLELVRNYVRMG